MTRGLALGSFARLDVTATIVDGPRFPLRLTVHLESASTSRIFSSESGSGVAAASIAAADLPAGMRSLRIRVIANSRDRRYPVEIAIRTSEGVERVIRIGAQLEAGHGAWEERFTLDRGDGDIVEAAEAPRSQKMVVPRAPVVERDDLLAIFDVGDSDQLSASLEETEKGQARSTAEREARELVTSEPVASEPVASEPTASEPAASEPAASPIVSAAVAEASSMGAAAAAPSPVVTASGADSASPDRPTLAAAERRPDAYEYPVWFGTNHTAVMRDGELAFDNAYSETVTYGRRLVLIPPWHEAGSLGSNWLVRLVTRRDDRVRVISTEILAADAFWRNVALALDEVPREQRQAVVFIHGYNVGFDDASRRAAQLGFDLKIGGAMGFFAWASQDSTLRYTSDEASIEASEQHIEEFLVDFATRTGADSVHVIAHSMGNRAVLRAVDRIVARAARASQVRFGQVILAAPDVTPALFRHLASAYRDVARRTTIYVSSRDKALALSQIIHGGPRTGDSGEEVMVVDGLDTVVATFVDSDFLGHSYVMGAREFLTDMFLLIHSDAPPSSRFGLDPIPERSRPKYWVMRA